MPEIDGFDSLVSKLNQAKKLSSDIEKSWKNISDNAKKVGVGKGSGGAGGGGATGGFGGSFSGGGSMPSQKDIKPSMFGGISSTREGVRAYGGLGGLASATSNAFNTSTRKDVLSDIRIATSEFGGGDLLTYLGSLAGAVNKFMPDVADTMNRATGYYNAGVYGGNTMGRRGLQDITFGTLGSMNALTSKGSDARVAQFLAGRGMSASGETGSTYQQTLRTVGNAARYLNISNEEAAASVEGMTSAKGAANMLRNFGIYTADISSGKEKSQGQIFEELAQRLTAGRGQATVEQTQASIRRGALGVTIDSFFQGDEQGGRMFKQYMIERAKGRKMDLSQQGDVAASLGSSGNINPLNAQMAMATSDTAVMQNAEQSFIAGINTATGALQVLNVVAQGFAKSLGGVSAFMQTLFGAGTTQGLVQGATSTWDFTSKGLTAIGQSLLSANPIGAAVQAGIVTTGLTAGLAAGAASLFGGSFGGITVPTAPTTTPTNTGGTGGVGFTADSYDKTHPAGSGNSAASGSRKGKLFDISVIAYGHSIPAGGEFGNHTGAHADHVHQGTDYNYNYEAVHSMADGTVSGVQKNAGTSKTGYGNYVMIQSQSTKGEWFTVLYGHLSKVSVSRGQSVVRGQKIGVSGNSGHSTGAHLHVEVRKGKQTTPGVGTAVPLGSVKGTSGSTALSGGSTTTPGADGTSTSYDPTAMYQSSTSQIQGQYDALAASQAANLGILTGLYSGNKKSILASIGAMANNMGVSSVWNQGIVKANDTYLPGSTSVAPGVSVTPGGGGGGNQVNITVQVPDVTSADAIKFAQMVKQYLDDNSLISNIGNI